MPVKQKVLDETQMSLFFLREEDKDRYSHTIELYDAVPKYYWGRPERQNGKYLPVMERNFVHHDKSYRVKINPVRLQRKNSKTGQVEEVEVYPSQREELVEDALRKMACEGAGTFFLDDKGIEEAGVVFSLYALQKELARTGHTYNLDMLKESMQVCAKTVLEIYDTSNKALLIAPMFSSVGLVSREDLIEKTGDGKCFVRFNQLVTKSIKKRTYRQYNYQLAMAFKLSLSRWLFKRMSHNYRQASRLHPYSILLSTILRDTGCKKYQKISHNIRDIEKSLNEMIDKKVLAGYDTQVIYDANRRNRIKDAKFVLVPGGTFISDMVRFNQHARSIAA